MYKRTVVFFSYWSLLILLCTNCPAFSQQNSNSLVEQFNAYTGKAIQEKLYLHTDKEFYIAGEIAWFKIYYVDGSTHKPLRMSKVAYVEIFNDKNEPVQQAKISLLPDESKGSLYLPTSLNTGYYTIRAYTNWMQNFDAGYFFEKKIAIVNTIKSPESTGSAESAIATVRFFPEGGNLVNDIESKIGFVVNTASGGVNDAQGYVVDKNNDTVTSFKPHKFGIGNFTLKPVSGNSYKAIVIIPGGTAITQILPAAQNEGYVMNLKEAAGKLTVTIWKKGSARPAEQLLLAVHTRQVIKVAEKTFINANEAASFSIDKNKLGEGISHFTLFNEDGKPLCERLYFKKPVSQLDLSVTPDKAIYGKREAVGLSIAASNNAVNSPLNLSASVFHIDSLQEAGKSTIVDYMWLVADLPGNVESPDYYFSNDADVATATDNLMLTHGWRRFNWEDISKPYDGLIKYMPELNGHLVSGIIKDARDGKIVPDVNAYLSISGQPFGFYTAKSDSKGVVRFEIKKYYGNSQVIAQSGIDIDSNYKVEIIKPFSSIAPSKRYTPYLLSENIKDQLLRKSIGMQVQNVYSGDSLKNFSNPFIKDTLPFFGLPENTYWLDDYKRFTTMEEVLREYVREIGVGSRQETLIFKMFNPAAHDFYDGNALVLLDGVALTNANRIFSYDPLKVKKIEVIRDRYVLGQSTFNGVASFTTYDGMFDGFELDTKLVAIDYSGLQLQREFYSPVYSSKEQLEKRLPDFRNTLFWDGNIKAGNGNTTPISFYSSDLPGKYVVVIQGMNAEGKFVAATAVFEVK